MTLLSTKFLSMKKKFLPLVLSMLCMNMAIAQLEYNMQPNSSDTLTVCSAIIYDEGGPDGNHGNMGMNYMGSVLVIRPETPNEKISISGSYILEGNSNAYLQIYDGEGADANNLIARYPAANERELSGGTVPHITSTTGSLTIKFVAYVNNGAPGFELSVQCVTCLEADSLGAADITENSATLYWRSVMDAATWSIEYGPKGFTPGMGRGTYVEYAISPYAIDDLIPGMDYDFFVRTNCGNENSFWAGPYSFRTTCADSMAAFPWTHYFDSQLANDSVMPDCWTRLNTVTDRDSTVFYPSVTNGASYSGTQSLRMSSDRGANTYAITPRVTESFNNLKLTFRMRGSQNQSQLPNSRLLYVGVMSDPNDEATYYPVDTLQPASDWTLEEVFFENIPDQYQYLAFKYYNILYTHGIWIDDVVLDHNGCRAPAALNTDTVGQDYAKISWAVYGSEYIWEVAYGKSGFSLDTVNRDLVMNIPQLEMYDLDAGTAYDIYIRTICGAGDTSAWSVKYSFLTNQIAAVVPYVCDFESGDENAQWALINNTDGNRWYIGSVVNNTENGDKALYISENGTRHSYDGRHKGVVWAYRDIYFEEEADSYELRFDWKCNGRPFWDYFRVLIGDAFPVEPLYGEGMQIQNPAGAVVLAEELNNSSEWVTQSIILDGNYAGTTKRLYFVWRNDVNTENNPPAAVDNISILAKNCTAPTDLTAQSVDDTTTVISWTAAYADDIWTIEYGLSGFTRGEGTFLFADDGVSQIVLQDLIHNAPYDLYIRTDCTSDSSNWISLSFIADNAYCTPATLPIEQSFDADTVISQCWAQHLAHQPATQNTVPQLVVTETYGVPSVSPYNGDHMLLFNSYSYHENSQVRLVSPPFNTQGSLPGVETEFMWWHNNRQSTLTNEGVQIQYSLDKQNWVDAGDFISRYSATLSGWTSYIVVLPQEALDQEKVYVGYLFNSQYGQDCFIDNIRIQNLTTCSSPVELSVTNVTKDAAEAAWEDGPLGTPAAYNLQYRPENSSNWITVNNVANPYLFSNLLPNTKYEVRVQSDCSGDGSSRWSESVSFTTSCEAISEIPYTENFYATFQTPPSSVPDCWNRIADYSVGSTNPVIYPCFDMGNFHSSPASLTFRSSTSAPTMVTTPEFHTGFDTLKMSFFLISDSINSGTMEIGYLTDIEDTSTFTSVMRIDTAVTEWTEYTFSFYGMDSPGESYYIAFKHTGADPSKGFNLDDFTLERNTFTITASAHTGGSITPSGEVEVIIGGSATFTLIPEQNYFVSALLVNGDSVDINTSYVFNNVMNDQTIEAYFTIIDKIDVYDKSASVIVYPNPARDVLNIRFTDSSIRISEIEICDIYGKLIKKVHMDNVFHQVDIGDLVPGMYLLRMKNNQNIISKKFIKQ